MGVQVVGGVNPSAQDSRNAAVRIAAATYETVPRAFGNVVSNVAATSSGTMRLNAIWLPAGAVIGSITCHAGTTAIGTPTNQWFGIYDSARGRWAVTADDTSTAWGANTAKTLAIAEASTSAGGSLAAASSFTIPTSGLWYIACVAVAGTPPSFLGATQSTLSGASQPYQVAPLLFGTSTGSLTNPASAPTTAGAITVAGGWQYCYVS